MAGTIPVVSMLLINSKNPSSKTCSSVNKNVIFRIGCCGMNFLNNSCNCSLKCFSSNLEVILIPHKSYLAIKVAIFVKDCFPEPPTPTNNALPFCIRMILCIRIK